MAQETLNTRQRLALAQEMETAVYLIQEGILALNRLDGANDFSHLPLELLAQGFERLIKLALALCLLDEEGALPEGKRLRLMGGRTGHRVDALVEQLLTLAERTSYAESSHAARTEHRFMREDRLLKELVEVMSEFGEGGRYHALDELLDPASAGTSDSPSQRFAAIENMVLDQHPEWQSKLASPEFEGFWTLGYGEMTSALQRMARAICRYFTLGPCREQGKALTATFGALLFLTDKELNKPTRPWYDRK